jgi:AAA+ ATPase superfamily predicted ATPase
MMRGRRRVGKSRLVTEFIQRCSIPAMYFQAYRNMPARDQLAALVQAIAESSLPGAAYVSPEATPSSLTGAFRMVAGALPRDTPSIVVLDEVPWLLEAIRGGAGQLQQMWDHELERLPVLLILMGSDVAMMRELTAYDQPFHGRAREIVISALTPGDIAAWTGTRGIDAFDAYLLTGGQPLVASEWGTGMTPQEFVETSLARPASALVSEGIRVLDGEFPPESSARTVLTAMGGRGERSFAKIQRSVGESMAVGSLRNALDLLTMKQVVTWEDPYSARLALRDRRWRIADPALRFWLALVEPSLGDIDRGRHDLAVRRFNDGYAQWRGRAIEPVVREALALLLPNATWPEAHYVGGWWPRNNIPEIDLVAGDAQPAHRLSLVGTIKWRSTPLRMDEYDSLAESAPIIPGFRGDTSLVGVCPGGAGDAPFSQVWNADDLLAAYGQR